jgi:hypothetical protein
LSKAESSQGIIDKEQYDRENKGQEQRGLPRKGESVIYDTWQGKEEKFTSSHIFEIDLSYLYFFPTLHALSAAQSSSESTRPPIAHSPKGEGEGEREGERETERVTGRKKEREEE